MIGLLPRSVLPGIEIRDEEDRNDGGDRVPREASRQRAAHADRSRARAAHRARWRSQGVPLRSILLYAPLRRRKGASSVVNALLCNNYWGLAGRPGNNYWDLVG